MVVPFDEFDKHSLSIFMSSERNMLNPTGSWAYWKEMPGSVRQQRSPLLRPQGKGQDDREWERNPGAQLIPSPSGRTDFLLPPLGGSHKSPPLWHRGVGGDLKCLIEAMVYQRVIAFKSPSIPLFLRGRQDSKPFTTPSLGRDVHQCAFISKY